MSAPAFWGARLWTLGLIGSVKGGGVPKSKRPGWGQAVHIDKHWSGWRDSNPRPPDPQSGALPGCATSRRIRLCCSGLAGFRALGSRLWSKSGPNLQPPRPNLVNPAPNSTLNAFGEARRTIGRRRACPSPPCRAPPAQRTRGRKRPAAAGPTAGTPPRPRGWRANPGWTGGRA